MHNQPKGNNMADDKIYPWKGSRTSPDVTMIQRRWPDLKPGDQIGYADIAELIGEAEGSTRFRTVTDAWRSAEMDMKGLVIYCEKGRGFYVATPEQVTGATHGAFRHIRRTAKKQRERLVTIRSTDERIMASVEHQGRLLIAIERDAKKSQMNILPSVKTEEPVKRLPPKAGAA